MANKLFGIADPYYDALRVQSNQAIWPDAGGSTSGLGGVLENKIYVWHSDGSTIDTFDPTDAGLTDALAAAASGDTVWIPSFTIGGNHTVPAGVGVYGIDRTQTILTGQITLSAGSSLGNLSISRSGGASNVTCIVGPSSGIARVISCLLLAVTTSGTPLAASSSGANTLYLEDCQISALKNGTSIDPFGASTGTLIDTFSIDSSVATYQYGAVATTIGINYRVEVSGDNRFTSSSNDRVDANYKTLDNWSTQTIEWGMQFSDGTRPTSDEGTYQSSHVYNFTRPGTGAAFGGRLSDSDYTDNVGVWTVRVYVSSSAYAVNVEGCEFDSTVSGIPQWGDRSAWDDTDYASRHARDIEDGTYLYHHNPSIPLTSGFAWYNVRTYGAVGDGATDDTAAINATITAIPLSGGVLYFPAGKYLTSGGFALSKPITVRGDGSGAGAAASAVSVVYCNSATANLFTVSVDTVSFLDIELFNNAGSTPSAGAGIYVSAGGDQAHYNNLVIDQFYDGLHFDTGGQWIIDGTAIFESVRYGVFAKNSAFPDWGDWVITNSYFNQASRAGNSAIHIESGGGGKISDIKTNGGFTNAIEVSLTGITTSILLLSNNSIENFHGDGIHITTGGSSPDYSLINIVGNQFGAYLSNSGGNAIDIAASNLGEITQVLIDGNQFRAGGIASMGYAISITKLDNVRIGASTFNAGAWTGLLTQSGCTNVVVDATGTVTNIATGTGLTGGPITTTGTISDANTGVTLGTYGDASNIPQFTVNAQGRITSASNIAISTLVPINVYNEMQTADGINTIYYLTNYAAPSTIRVYIDGVRQPASDDTAPTDVVSFGVAPDAGAVLLFDYEMDQT